ncbi:MAG: MFS transporter [Dehalococcoidales bacterium]|nr:MFS transporter [Dehalococcoidales bacterium]
MNRPSLWTRDYLCITAVNFFFALNFYLLVVQIPVYVIDVLDSSPSQAGLASGIFVIGALIMRLLSGKWIERIGRKRTLFTGLIAGLVMTLLYFTAGNIISLLIIRFFHGATFGISSTAAGTIIGGIVPKEKRGEGIGYFALSVTLATAIGPFLGIFLSGYGGFNLIFLASSIAAAAALATAFLLSFRELRLSREEAEEIKSIRLKDIIEPRVVPIAIICMGICFCFASVLSFLAVYAKEVNLTEAAGYFFIVYAIVVFFSRPVVGRLFDSRGENLIMYSAIIVLLAGMIVFSQASRSFTLLLSGALIGLGYGAVQSSGQAIYTKIVPKHRLGLATSTFYIFLDSGVAIGPITLGLIVPFIGYRGIYLVTSAVAALCLVLYYYLHGRKAHRIE